MDSFMCLVFFGSMAYALPEVKRSDDANNVAVLERLVQQRAAAATAVCNYKGQEYRTGETWQDGCDKNCTCRDGNLNHYQCYDLCDRITSVPTNCKLVKDAEGCCDLLSCPSAHVDFLDDSCEDPLDNCAEYGQEACQGQFIPWAKRNCPYYCGFEPCPGVTPITDPTCQDKLPNCVDYTKDGCIGQFEPWARENCQLFCNYCPTDVAASAHTDIGCVDLLSDCKSYGAYVCQDPYTEWARKNCKNTCGFCASVITDDICVDMLSDCESYGAHACRPPYTEWARKNCNYTCGFCVDITHYTPACEDVLSDCESYGTYACQPPYTEWARKNCNYTCGFCGGGPIGRQIGHNYQGLQQLFGDFSSQRFSSSGYGWVTLMKGVRGVPNDDLYELWSSPETRNADRNVAMVPTADFFGNYKSDASNHWNECKFDQVKVAIWNCGQEKAFIIFDARNSDKMSWFTQDRIIDSSFSDIKTASTNVFSMQGDTSMGREFYINQDSQGCAGSGWIMVSTQSNCFYERTGARANKPTFYYSKTDSAGSWVLRAEGDVFMISGHGGLCE